MSMKLRNRMLILGHSVPETKSVDLCLQDDFSHIVLGVRLVGHTDYRSPHIQAACIGVLSYADENKRTVDSLLNYS